MRISVIIPCWNAEAYIEEAIASARSQTPAPFEIVVVDDGSTDRCAEILAGLDGLRIIRQPNAGVGAALNSGIMKSTGDSIAFLDADDVWMPGKLAAQVSALASQESLDGVFGQVRQFTSPELSAEQREGLRVDQRVLPGFLKSSLLIRRRSMMRLGPFDVTRRHADFVDWFARATQRGFRWKMLPTFVCKRRIHAANMSRMHRTEQHDDYLLALRTFLQDRRANSSSLE